MIMAEWRSQPTRSYLEASNAGTLTAFLKGEATLRYKRLSLYRENSKVMLAHELSFQMMDSKVLGFLEFSDFSLLELPNYVTHNMLLHYCEIRMENYF